MNWNDNGVLGKAAAIVKLLSLGYNVSIPVSDSLRYDLVAERAGAFFRVQVKTLADKWDAEVVEVKPYSCRVSRARNVRRLYSNAEIDVLLIYWITTGRWLWLDLKSHPEFNNRHGLNFRIGEAKNGQTKGIRTFVDFEV